ncbi:restriction endonuclease [Plesiomonas shigelloides]|uniref:restriction endonuclease n=1 Tax=Plesiomonas shigelloides TaxID=703 RepID=UPI0017804FF1|nr:restriction endonuclease [Plesiomonas shigelloides]QOH80997.1 restriction endonuclease [Plesiomonas shigelloides]
MKVTRFEVLINSGEFFSTKQFNKVLKEINDAISQVVWPINSTHFSINPVLKGNGVKPIKNGCMSHLEKQGWKLEERLKISRAMRPGPLDAVKALPNGGLLALEWETGNISSSHRALNKMVLGMLEGALCGGVLILPSRNMYKYLTDRIGNFQEIEPYFPQWKRPDISNGFLAVIEIEHEYENKDVPLIPKGTDGWAEFQGN